FTHASGVEPASAFVATINWGDSSTSAGTITLSGTTYTVKGSHTYAQNGSHTVSTTVTEPTGSGGNPIPGPGTGAGATATTPGGSASGGASAEARLRDLISANKAGASQTGSANWLAVLSNRVDSAGEEPVTDTD